MVTGFSVCREKLSGRPRFALGGIGGAPRDAPLPLPPLPLPLAVVSPACGCGNDRSENRIESNPIERRQLVSKGEGVLNFALAFLPTMCPLKHLLRNPRAEGRCGLRLGLTHGRSFDRALTVAQQGQINGHRSNGNGSTDGIALCGNGLESPEMI